MNARLRLIRSAATIALFGALASCKPVANPKGAGSKSKQQTYVVQGFLRSINFAERTVTVEHEEILHYMPAMTMPLDVSNMAEVKPLKAGDAIEFRMIVTENNSWIEGVKKIAPTSIQLPARKTSPSASAGNIPRLKEGDTLPDFQLIDSRGRKVTRETFSGKPLLLTFIFTRCPLPNYCPLMMENFSAVQKALASDPSAGTEVQYLSVSFDSAYDTPEILAQYADRHTNDTDRWRFASGSADEIQKLTRAFSMQVEAEGGTINHSLATALIDPDGTIRKILRGNGWKPEEVVAALEGL